MSEQTVVAAPSAAPVVEIDRGPLVTLSSDQRAEFRRTGEIPEPPTKEESAPSDTEKDQPSEAEEAKTAGDPEPPKKPQEQNRRKPGAEHRIGELTPENKRLKAELEGLRTPKPTPEAAKPAEAPQPQAPQARQKPTADDKTPDGKPKYTTYEDYVEDLTDWKFEQRTAAAERQQQQRVQAKVMDSQLQDARTRYGDKFDEVLKPTVNAIVNDATVSPVVRAMLNDSEMLPDLIFTLGSDAKELASFVEMAKTNPGKAIRYIALTESLIREELESKATPETKEAPAKPKTAAPKPPTEVGGRAATPEDQMESAAKRNDYRSFAAEANRRALASLKRG